jgi:hypothetical protein
LNHYFFLTSLEGEEVAADLESAALLLEEWPFQVLVGANSPSL